MFINNFLEIFELNVYKSGLSKNLIILYTAEYEHIAVLIFNQIKSFFNVSSKKLESIFDKNLETYILEKDIFLLFFSFPWKDIKNYYSIVRPLLIRYAKRSYVIRDCVNNFKHIYAMSFEKINQLNQILIKLGENTQKVLIKNSLGTELEFIFEKQSWHSIDGTNIPNEVVPSEVSTYTPHVNGRVVFTGALLSLVPIGKKYGLIKEPIILNIENGFVRKVSCNDVAIQNDLQKMYEYCEGNSEIVELGIGTNSGVKLLGISAPFEERKTGFHLGIGGSQVKSQHLDFIFEDSDIYFDQQCIFSNNQFHVM
jgi:leucyl aminopeptidase (aminopeptidase T)